MKRRTAIGVVVLSVLAGIGIVGCQQSEISESLVTIDVKADYPEKELTLQDFMEVEYIPLETNDEFITQGSVKAIGRDYLVVTNRINDGNIYMFDRKTGKGVRKINRMGQGAEEYAFINGIVLDEDNGEMFVNSASMKKIFVYDLQGNFKRSFNHAEGADYLEVYDYDKDNLICYDMSLYYKDGEKRENKFYHALISKQDGSVTRGIPIPFDIVKAPFVQKGDMVAVSAVRSITPYRENWLLVETSSDTVYRYTSAKGKLTPFLVKKSTTEPEVMLSMGVVTDRYYFMQAIEKVFNFEKGRGFPSSDLMYDKQEAAVFKPVVFNADNDKRVELVMHPEGGEIASFQSLSADQLVEGYQNNELKGRLKEIAGRLNEESNPVILLVKHKK